MTCHATLRSLIDWLKARAEKWLFPNRRDWGAVTLLEAATCVNGHIAQHTPKSPVERKRIMRWEKSKVGTWLLISLLPTCKRRR